MSLSVLPAFQPISEHNAITYHSSFIFSRMCDIKLTSFRSLITVQVILVFLIISRTLFTEDKAKKVYFEALEPRARVGFANNGEKIIISSSACIMNNKKQAYDAKYGTHLPVLVSLLSLFPVGGVLELGGGIHSTQLFHQASPIVLTVENDEQWYKVLLQKFNNFNDLKRIILDKTKFKRKEKLIWIDVAEKASSSVKLYRQLLSTYPAVNFLFVDHFIALRPISMLTLVDFMDIIVFHDTESPAYGYDGVTLVVDTSMFEFFEVTATLPYTSMLIRKSFMAKALAHNQDVAVKIKEQLEIYCSHPDSYASNSVKSMS